MKDYTIITAEDVKAEFSQILKRYIGPKGTVSYKKAAKELEVEERTLGSWVRGEKQITLSSFLKLSVYLPYSFTQEVLTITELYK